jgi:hypothetical protein
MVIDFAAVRARTATIATLVSGLSPDDLARATEESISGIEGLMADVTDADVTFVPVDPAADDPAAAEDADRGLAWTLGHLIVHVTASAEESAALAAELARGVAQRGRSRWEIPWQSVTTVEQCRQRLAESRRMRLASLQMWPDRQPVEVDSSEGVPTWAQARERFARGLAHEDGHVEQIAGVIGQARAARA